MLTNFPRCRKEWDLGRWRPLSEALGAHSQIRPRLGPFPFLAEPPAPRTRKLIENYRSVFTIPNLRTTSSSSVLDFVLDLEHFQVTRGYGNMVYQIKVDML